ncbi:FAD-dependent oxidoreductase [Aeromicrobium phragmitis]|uniref:FAD-dependent oxidoreductase n=1 Tax=Aeromicrobium phragmitis TaxID=2478914 RepID=A0A3L8PQW3_9ACTN|nr:FAD-dependent oxidoreductase [Aeromicrobium phragmitis]RLV56412.1 FAD-dependent oxidoreductase [Aeromicrobium phragmitis]
MSDRPSWWGSPAPASSPDEWMDDADFDDIVVGAGITGTVTALLLAQAGRRVAILEARSAGAGTTGRSTAKVTALQGVRTSRIERHHGRQVSSAYAAAQLDGLDWLVRFAEDNPGWLEQQDAYTVAQSAPQRSTTVRELQAARRAGLPVEWTEETELPFRTFGAVVLRDQAQVDPMLFIGDVVGRFRAGGGRLVEGVRVTEVLPDRNGYRVRTDHGEVRSQTVTVATGTPILDRGGHFARLHPERSYALVTETDDEPPHGMYLTAGSSPWSVRSTMRDDRRVLLTGGAGHVTGRGPSESSCLRELKAWTRIHFDATTELSSWSAQDYSTPDGLPIVGQIAGEDGLYTATGYAKWGFTNGVAAALDVSGRILGDRPPWASSLYRNRATLRKAVGLVNYNLGVAAQGALRWTKGLTQTGPSAHEPTVVRQGATPTTTGPRELSAVCTHLQGVVRWNSFEESWDCPLHGSRFDEDGGVIEGPAVCPLRAKHEHYDRSPS